MALSPPDRSALRALDDDAWSRLVGHSRRAVRELDATGAERSDAWARIRDSSTVDLLSGEGRAALESELAAGTALWESVAPQLEDEDEAGWRDRLRPPEPDDPTPARSGPDPELLRRRKERIRELTEERDRARRQVEGAEARARAADERADAAERELRQAHERIAGLEGRLERAVDEQRATLDRQRRQHESELAELQDELRSLRRAEQERQLEERRRAEARAAAAEAEARRPTDDGRSQVVPGRPSQLPADIQPGTSAAARALLTREHHVLVDGYNVTKQHRGHLDLEQQRAALIALLEAAAARFACRFEVVFDSEHGSPPGRGGSRSIRVTFTQAHVTADDEIALAVAAAPEDQPVLVVTDDRELRERVGAHAVDVLGTGEFLRAVE